MVRLRDIMTTDIVVLSPESTVREAMELFAQHHVSGAPVVSGDELVGVVSASDLLTFVSSLSGVPTERDIHDGWGGNDETTMDDDVDAGNEASGAFFAELWDDSGAEVTSRMGNVGGPEWDTLEEHDVSELMTRTPLVTLPPDASAESAAELMGRRKIHRVLVTEAERLVGVVTALDITRAVANHRFTVRRYVFNSQ